MILLKKKDKQTPGPKYSINSILPIKVISYLFLLFKQQGHFVLVSYIPT